MPSPPDCPDDDDASDSHLSFEAIDRDLERLGELTGPYVTDTSDDLAVAAVRIPDADLRREAEELLDRLRPLADSHLVDSITPTGESGLQPA
jgi:nucleotide-binding universal stress UspA family protein